MKPSRHVLLLAVLCLFAPGLAAQQLGPTYKDEEHGFSIKPPKDWAAIPTPPTEKWVLVKFQDKIKSTSKIANVVHSPEMQIIYFPKIAPETGTGRPGAAPGQKPSGATIYADRSSFQSYDEYLKKRVPQHTLDKPKQSKMSGVPATTYEILQTGSVTVPLKRYCVVFHADHADIAVEGQVLEDQWKKFKKEVVKSIRSFRLIEIKAAETGGGGDQVGTEEEQFLQAQIDKLPPGWYHLWSPRKRYLFLSDAEKSFTVELSKHIEAIRDVYEKLYPPDRPIEDVSIVRVCKSKDEYTGYGGPPSSAGYWNFVARELVFYDAKNRNRNDSFAVLYHEAFHQYIFYFYGQIAPASWYNEGHGDYFSGAVFRGSKIQKMTPFRWRVPIIKDAIRTKSYKPLKELLAFTKQQYYAEAELCYAQGWSVVWFLREGRLKPEWKQILPDYLDNLVTSYKEIEQVKGQVTPMDQEKIQKDAHEATFADWTDEDWEEFEAAWLKFVG